MKTQYKLLSLVEAVLVLIFLCSCQPKANLPGPTTTVQVPISPTGTMVSATNTPTPAPVVQIQTPQVETITDISNMIGLEFYPSWSPDGSKIVFQGQNRQSMDDAYGNNIYLMNADGSQQIMLTENAPMTDYRYPSWSPDGSRIVYVQGNRSRWTINTMQLDGSQKAELISCDLGCTHPKWSPDGRNIIYFESDYDRPVILMVKYDISSQQKEVIYQRDIMEYQGPTFSLSYSPDGSKILFYISEVEQLQDGNTSYKSTVYIMDANGSNLKEVANATFPAWAPDGRKIIFVMFTSSGDSLYISSPDGSDLTRYTYGNYGEILDPSWSPDGSTLVFAAQSPLKPGSEVGREIFEMKTRDNAELTKNMGDLNNLAANPNSCPLGSTFVAELDASAQEYIWSPDLSMIAFVSSFDGDNEVYVMNSDGKEVRKITNNEFDDTYITWFPNSKGLVFTSNRGSTFDLYSANLGGNISALLAESVMTYDISPDGRSIAYDRYYYGSRGLMGDIYVMDTDGNNKVQLIQTEYGSQHPVWSPDGSKIYFEEIVETPITLDSYWGPGDLIGPRIMSMNRDGTDIRQLTNAHAQDYIGMFSPDRENMLFRSDRDHYKDFKVYKMNVNGENQTKLADHPGWAAWWPQGDWITVFRENSEGAILNGYVIDENGNFLMDLPEVLNNGFGWLDDKNIAFSVENDETISLCVAIMSDLIP